MTDHPTSIYGGVIGAICESLNAVEVRQQREQNQRAVLEEDINEAYTAIEQLERKLEDAHTMIWRLAERLGMEAR